MMMPTRIRLYNSSRLVAFLLAAALAISGGLTSSARAAEEQQQPPQNPATSGWAITGYVIGGIVTLAVARKLVKRYKSNLQSANERLKKAIDVRNALSSETWMNEVLAETVVPVSANIEEAIPGAITEQSQASSIVELNDDGSTAVVPAKTKPKTSIVVGLVVETEQGPRSTAVIFPADDLVGASFSLLRSGVRHVHAAGTIDADSREQHRELLEGLKLGPEDTAQALAQRHEAANTEIDAALEGVREVLRRKRHPEEAILRKTAEQAKLAEEAKNGTLPFRLAAEQTSKGIRLASRLTRFFGSGSAGNLRLVGVLDQTAASIGGPAVQGAMRRLPELIRAGKQADLLRLTMAQVAGSQAALPEPSVSQHSPSPPLRELTN